jgi:hypothetical protein
MIDLAPFLGGTVVVVRCWRMTILVLVIDLGLDVPGVGPVVALHGRDFLPGHSIKTAPIGSGGYAGDVEFVAHESKARRDFAGNKRRFEGWFRSFALSQRRV